ncbi:hypothetical protein HrrHm1_295 [Halorubrum virus Humcor1]|nr:hypothetical protein HrrHm1_295 [Halorubrum virus Humcor1]
MSDQSTNGIEQPVHKGEFPQERLFSTRFMSEAHASPLALQTLVESNSAFTKILNKSTIGTYSGTACWGLGARCSVNTDTDQSEEVNPCD